MFCMLEAHLYVFYLEIAFALFGMQDQHKQTAPHVTEQNSLSLFVDKRITYNLCHVDEGRSNSNIIIGPLKSKQLKGPKYSNAL